ncbi:hypothetical protein Poli38472_011635 [Pythium oligandrum]|uniref:Uncharacterized protein n=1 Tax=Pythium oligandrum TaxID=41045 RepID=A0A8K1FI98_PYTOL|nr:hypothetical protein Poli38472_011635 [Pythium oligandrum]|eukprot:TMW64755.1 hypothetical protein Poli38472_011635 [Pythium oligandrum]
MGPQVLTLDKETMQVIQSYLEFMKDVLDIEPTRLLYRMNNHRASPYTYTTENASGFSAVIANLFKSYNEDKSFDKTLFNSLDDAEREFMKYLLNKCKITSRGFESAYNEGLDVYVKRLKHLQGAQDIGDDNPNIKKEMLGILDTLYNKGVFTPGYYNAFKRAITNRNADGNWRTITSQRQNNTFKIIWPTASTTQAYTITLPDGTYTAQDINAYLQYWSIQNNLYLINNTTGNYYYFISCAENVSSYAIQFNMQPVRAVSGYTAASGFPTMSVTAYTPQLQIIDSGAVSFSSIVGLTQGTYPAAQTTSLYSVYSNFVPTIDPTAAVVIGISNLYNPLANNSQVLHTFTSAGVEYGALVTTSQGQGISYCPMQGTNNEIILSFYDQNMMPLQLIDPNVCIRLLMCPKKLADLN